MDPNFIPEIGHLIRERARSKFNSTLLITHDMEGVKKEYHN